MKLRIGYPDRSSELELLSRNSKTSVDLQAKQILQGDQLVLLQQAVTSIAVELPVREYLLDLAQSTRSNRSFPLGLSPRGLLQWQRVAQAYAMLQERSFVIPEDVQAVAMPVLAVRLSSNAMSTEKAIESVIESVPVPRL
jgi:MoxR-like ATPase